jgi:hypothetical protein
MLLWKDNTEETSAVYVGQPGHTYGFAAVGRDQAGNQGPIPLSPQATARIADILFYLPVTLLNEG